MNNPYDERYDRDGYYWGTRPSSMCFRVLQLLPPDRPLRLLDIGCGGSAAEIVRNTTDHRSLWVSHLGVWDSLHDVFN